MESWTEQTEEQDLRERGSGRHSRVVRTYGNMNTWTTHHELVISSWKESGYHRTSSPLITLLQSKSMAHKLRTARRCSVLRARFVRSRTRLSTDGNHGYNPVKSVRIPARQSCAGRRKRQGRTGQRTLRYVTSRRSIPIPYHNSTVFNNRSGGGVDRPMPTHSHAVCRRRL